jgi:hypothetical protein
MARSFSSGTLSPNLSVEFYVEDHESWDTVTVVESGIVRQEPIIDEDALLALLASLVPAHAAA